MAVGIIIGLLIATLIVVTLTYFRHTTERTIKIIEKNVQGPKPKGFIIEAEDEASRARRELLEENSKQGRPTKLSDLYGD